MLPIHRVALTNSLKQITKKAVLPAIHVTGVCEINSNEEFQQNQVSYRSSHHHRISAQSGSTAYGSMRSDSMNVESGLFLPSNHSSMVCVNLVQNIHLFSSYILKRLLWFNIQVHHHMNMIAHQMKIYEMH